MGMLKLNRIIYFIIIFLSISCTSCQKTNAVSEEKKENQCGNDNVINLRQGQEQLFLSFAGQYEKKILTGAKIEQIRSGKVISELPYNFENGTASNVIKLNDKLSLHTMDSLKITFNDKKEVILYDFKNTPDYGGKRFLGCSFGSYKVGQKSMETKNAYLYIY